MLKLRDICYTYGQDFTLNIPYLDIPKAAIFGVTGKNGSGKTTLLKILSFLVQPQTGVIKYNDKIVIPKILPQLRQEATLLFQDTLLLKRTVFDNVAYGLKIRKNINDIKTKVHNTLSLVGLEPTKFANRQHDELSGGEAKRVALASRIILQPKVLLLDEPMVNVDRESWLLIIDALKNMVLEHQTTIIISGHEVAGFGKITNNIINLKNEVRDLNGLKIGEYYRYVNNSKKMEHFCDL